ncbi:hypothetical protein HPB51_009065 [Rhipicephalus microplus]|uniref:Uncharacterized protein n=1 Tax=Rhipicephalus microplus TaxID=6941 RepID=A0A9J6D9H6_RHIMP|nr:hypothetical protein HPB51_009065 [Rhipicephalus microplus]
MPWNQRHTSLPQEHQRKLALGPKFCFRPSLNYFEKIATAKCVSGAVDEDHHSSSEFNSIQTFLATTANLTQLEESTKVRVRCEVHAYERRLRLAPRGVATLVAGSQGRSVTLASWPSGASRIRDSPPWGAEPCAGRASPANGAGENPLVTGAEAQTHAHAGRQGPRNRCPSGRVRRCATGPGRSRLRRRSLAHWKPRGTQPRAPQLECRPRAVRPPHGTGGHRRRGQRAPSPGLGDLRLTTTASAELSSSASQKSPSPRTARDTTAKKFYSPALHGAFAAGGTFRPGVVCARAQ